MIPLLLIGVRFRIKHAFRYLERKLDKYLLTLKSIWSVYVLGSIVCTEEESGRRQKGRWMLASTFVF